MLHCFRSSQHPPSRSWCCCPAWTAALTPAFTFCSAVSPQEASDPGQRAPLSSWGPRRPVLLCVCPEFKHLPTIKNTQKAQTAVKQLISPHIVTVSTRYSKNTPEPSARRWPWIWALHFQAFFFFFSGMNADDAVPSFYFVCCTHAICIHIQIKYHWSWLKYNHWSWLKYTCLRKAYREKKLLWLIINKKKVLKFFKTESLLHNLEDMLSVMLREFKAL